MSGLDALLTSSTSGRKMLLFAALIAIFMAFIAGLSSAAFTENAYADNAPKATAKHVVKWVEKSSNIYCRVDGKLQKSGIKTIKGKKYLFSKKGIQLTGWHKIGKSCYYFMPKSKAKGFMATSKVINGIRIDKKGRAKPTKAAKPYLAALLKATNFVEDHTHGAWSQRRKLRACFNHMRDKYVERTFRRFSAKPGWTCDFAMDIFNRKSGNCHSFASAYAYIASVIGCKSCKVVSSGGHSWAEVNGSVYDPEWARHTKIDLFDFPYSRSGHGGSPMYRTSRKYIVAITRTSRL